MKVRFCFCDKNDYDCLYFDPDVYSYLYEMPDNKFIPNISYPRQETLRFIILYSIDNPNDKNDFILCARSKIYESLYGTAYFRFHYVKETEEVHLEILEDLPNDYIGLPHKELPSREKPHQLFIQINPKTTETNESEATIYSTYLGGIDYDSNLFSINRFL